MIARLRGKILEKQPNLAVIDVAGVGYAVTIPVSTYTRLGGVGDDASLHVYTHVREDTIALFGFHSKEEKRIFEHLITVSGIGPKLAVTILSGVPADELIQSIRGADVARLVRIPGVGKKTGERIILELREKLGAIERSEREGGAKPSSGIEQDVISALLNLGCTRQTAEAAVRQAKAAGVKDDFESIFRAALEKVNR